MDEKYLTLQPGLTIDESVESLDPDKVLVVTDSNVKKLVLPRLTESKVLASAPIVTLKPGEDGKTLDSVTNVWDMLEEIGATRRSLIINIGGGVVTDLGGFAAATYKRGIRTINFPTTLLGAVDAATGGKTGINYRGLKNEIGAFHMPSKVIVSGFPFSTLSKSELMSGYAEMVKTALISDRNFYISLMDVEKITGDELLLGEAVEKCVRFKDEVVAQDPNEKGLRKILNFGHTAGHAFESICLERKSEVTHGKAVAHGMLVALILSNLLLGFDSVEVYHYRRFLREYYGSPLISCEDIDAATDKMNRDKKNLTYGKPLFTLLKNIGEPEINCMPSEREIQQSLELYLDFGS